MLTIHEITAEISKDNANVHNSPASKMFEAGQAVYKKYVVTFVLPKDVADAHVNKDFHVHDIAYYPITYNCLAIPLEKMFREGFSTAHGYIRPPRSFMTSCALTAVAIQSCQNDGYGGVSVDMLDSILKTFARTSSDRDIRQGMESMVFNLNTLHSRAGNQVPFSSIAIGLDTDVDARRISHGLLDAYDAGLGKGEQAIFPQ
jgi:ribonucleoside-triphosphate reductase